MNRLITISTFLTLFFCCRLGNLNAQDQNDVVVTIYFDSNQYTLSNSNKCKIDSIFKYFDSKSFNFIKLFAYCDTSGTVDYNEWLSEKRAYSIWGYINSKTKIKNDHWYFTWIGESSDTYDLHFELAHPQTRSVDVWIQMD